MSERTDLLPENDLSETIKYLLRSVEEIKTRQGIGGEAYLQATPQWTGIWRAASTYDFATGSFVLIDFNDWLNYSWYFEVIGFTDKGTGFFRLWNLTDNVAVPNSEIQTDKVGQANAERIRSPALTKYTGSKVFRVQIKNVGGNGTSEFANCVMSRMVFKISG